MTTQAGLHRAILLAVRIEVGSGARQVALLDDLDSVLALTLTRTLSLTLTLTWLRFLMI